MAELGWEVPDFILVTGDAYVDHPSFGSAIIARYLQAYGYKVAVLAQPDWREAKSFTVFGEPRLGFLVTAGNMDSMVSHYTVNKKRRRSDVYTPGGEVGKRPDRAAVVYSAKLREAYKETPIILGGLEASLRRFAHYDYWQDKVRRPILFDAKADILVFGMGEKAILEVADSLAAGLSVDSLNYIKGTAVIMGEAPSNSVKLPSYEEVVADKRAYAKMAKLLQESCDPFCEEPFVQQVGERFAVQNPPPERLSQPEMDAVYALPYTFEQDPETLKRGPVPGMEEVAFSITANRGCFGNCSFCALAMHQGRYVQRRSADSILDEAKRLTELPDFKGYIHDIGGPTANFLNQACAKQEKHGVCKHRECLFPALCDQMDTDESDYLDILRRARRLPGVKKVFVRSGVRYDYMLRDHQSDFFKELVEHHVSGQLRVAPEHVSDKVLSAMGKPAFGIYEEFLKKFNKLNGERKQYVVPYFISGHPGSRLSDAVALAEYIKGAGAVPEQVQDFYPTPGTIATAMYYTGINPLTGENIHVPAGEEKAMQRALLQYNNPKHAKLVRQALVKVRRFDLIGNHPGALVRPENDKSPAVGGRSKREKQHKSRKEKQWKKRTRK